MGLAVPLQVETEGEDGRAGTLGSNFRLGEGSVRGVGRRPGDGGRIPLEAVLGWLAVQSG